MNYYYDEKPNSSKNLLLLHGTGGDEYSLVDIAHYLDDTSRILSFRGNIQENGMNRYFKRNGLNQFDIESLEEETDLLYEEIKKISAEKNVPLESWILVGYSNGANIGAHLLLERETELTKGIFFHPISLGVHTKETLLSDKKVWISYGENDPIVNQPDFEELITAFYERDADVTVAKTPMGHQIIQEEVDAAKDWLNDQD
ncbi:MULTISPECIES: alpha/beta hydrolase [unclassified Enterococcus]|jgi:phospholipase/carboxylesterase|uniref:alpha/beta hydrolase n=1 Tax=unclassified Enterococcus TaxID=2608891 RepID=UPI0003531773|nr:phospholipase/carboxylesterase [Enterococcus faecalis 13-SD-W-01]